MYHQDLVKSADCSHVDVQNYEGDFVFVFVFLSSRPSKAANSKIGPTFSPAQNQHDNKIEAAVPRTWLKVLSNFVK